MAGIVLKKPTVPGRPAQAAAAKTPPAAVARAAPPAKAPLLKPPSTAVPAKVAAAPPPVDDDALYEDISLFQSFAGEVEQAVAEAAASGEERDNVWFIDVNNRTYRMRFCPELRADPETGQPKLVLTRTIFSHSGFEKVRRIKCQGTGCPICKESYRLKDAKYDDAWRYGSKKEAIVRVRIHSATTSKDYKYLKTNEYGFVVLRNKAYNGLNSFLANLTPEEMRQVLNPKKAAPEILLTVTPGADGSAAWSFGLKPIELPPPPEDYKSVYDVYVQEDDAPTDDELKEIRKQVNRMLASMEGKLVQPEGGDGDAPAAARPPKAGAKAAVASALGKTRAAPAQEALSEPGPAGEPEGGDGAEGMTAGEAESGEEPVCPGADEGLAYGQNPQALGQEISATCLSCPYEGDESVGCIAQTLANVAAARDAGQVTHRGNGGKKGTAAPLKRR
jgi:hypothetical protein